MASAAQLIFAALAGLGLVLLLIIRFKVQAVVAILTGAIAIGLLAGMPFSEIVASVNQGIGETLKGIALLVGLGSMFGAILEVSGGAQSLSSMAMGFGDRKAAWALGLTGLIVAIPVFFDAGLIILIPLAFSMARRSSHSSLYYVIPLLDRGICTIQSFIACSRTCIHSSHPGSCPCGRDAWRRAWLGHPGRSLLRGRRTGCSRTIVGQYM